MVKLLDGKIPAKEILTQIKEEITVIKEQGILPGLITILVGNNLSSHLYVSHKQKACTKVGIYNQIYYLPDNSKQENVIQLISNMNKDPQFHGILIQLPLPPQLDEDSILTEIDPAKDVDGLTPTISGTLLSPTPPRLAPATPLAVLCLLDCYKYDVKGQHVVIVGASRIVGKPLAMMLIQKGATVTICHDQTKDLPSFTRQADILISATGHPKLIKRDMIKEGSVIIDVGITRIADYSRPNRYRIEGDVDFVDVKEKVFAITPVPGGIGPLTVALLLQNLIHLIQFQIGRKTC